MTTWLLIILSFRFLPCMLIARPMPFAVCRLPTGDRQDLDFAVLLFR